MQILLIQNIGANQEISLKNVTKRQHWIDLNFVKLQIISSFHLYVQSDCTSYFFTKFVFVTGSKGI